jgi:hypothetical protein
MGCTPSKLRTNVSSSEPTHIIGSTQLRADQIVVLGDSVFLPVRDGDDESGGSAIIEISIGDKKMHYYRGRQAQVVRSGISL